MRKSIRPRLEYSLGLYDCRERSVPPDRPVVTARLDVPQDPATQAALADLITAAWRVLVAEAGEEAPRGV